MITTNIKTLLLACSVCCCSIATLTSCNDIVDYDEADYVAPENQPNKGAPEILGIYEARDVIYDNALTTLSPGQRVRIHGKNLNHVQSLSFNGFAVAAEEAACAIDYCVVKVPEDFNVTQNAGLKYTTDMGTASFPVKIMPKPLVIEGLQNEFCAVGQTVVVKGNWFKSYNFGTSATSITLNGTDITPIDITNDAMTITVPQGTPDNSQLIVSWKDADGNQQSARLFYRPTAMMLLGQNLTGSDTWRLETDADVPAATPLGFPHLHLSGEMPQWQWNDLKIERVIDGLDTLTNRANYHFVFEVLTPKGQPLPSSADGFMDGFMFGLNQPDGSNGSEWEIDGGFDSEGQWQTVRLPLKEVMPFPAYSIASVHNVLLNIIFQTAVAGTYDVRLANFRLQRIPMNSELTTVKEEIEKEPREPLVTLSEDEHVVAGWDGYGIEADKFRQCEAGDVLTIYVKDVQNGAQVVLQDMGNWQSFNDADPAKSIATDATSYSYILSGEDAYKLKMYGLWITGDNYTATKVTLRAATE